MKRKLLNVTGVSLLVIATVANAGYLGYSLLHPPQSALSAVTNATLNVKSVKQHDIEPTKQGQKAESADYKYLSLAKSKIESPDQGHLVLASQKDLGANFILATNNTVDFNASKINPEWSTTTIADDPLWAPGACSSKPTLLLQGKYIFIDDGKTKPTDTYNSYVVYDIGKGKYNYFGGDNFTAAQSQREKILVATNENDQLVFYIDQLDDKGPLTNTSSFKHATGSDHGYLVRRVIDPDTMKYTDYHIAYTVPSGMPYFYLNAISLPQTGLLTVQLNGDYGTSPYEGTVVNNAIDFMPKKDYIADATPPTGPNDTAIEKELEGPLSTILPTYATKPVFDPKINATHFSVTEIGAHKDILFLNVGDRELKFNSPIVYDKSSKKASTLTTQDILNFQNYVPLGVF